MDRLAIHPNWFDWAALGWVLIGFVRGYQRGLSEEVLRILPWVLGILAAGFFHEKWGGELAGALGLGSIWSQAVVYAGIVAGCLLVFHGLRKWIGEKPVESGAFGWAERPLGMLGGALRYACMVVVLLALLNAPAYTGSELDAALRVIHQPGARLYASGAEAKAGIMLDSWLGRFAREHFGSLIIRSKTDLEMANSTDAPTRAKEVEKEIEKALGEKRSK